jgi:hypothetical protein
MDSENVKVAPSSQPTLDQAKAQLMSMSVNNENDALNIIVSFLNIAQRRGSFSLDESAKIFECIKMFQKPQ